MLVDINYRQGNQVEAIRRLDKLLGLSPEQAGESNNSTA